MEMDHNRGRAFVWLVLLIVIGLIFVVMIAVFSSSSKHVEVSKAAASDTSIIEKMSLAEEIKDQDQKVIDAAKGKIDFRDAFDLNAKPSEKSEEKEALPQLVGPNEGLHPLYYIAFLAGSDGAVPIVPEKGKGSVAKAIAQGRLLMGFECKALRGFLDAAILKKEISIDVLEGLLIDSYSNNKETFEAQVIAACCLLLEAKGKEFDPVDWSKIEAMRSGTDPCFKAICDPAQNPSDVADSWVVYRQITFVKRG